MRSRRFASLSRFCSCLLLATVSRWCGAAELGDAAVSSYIGQPLAAEIELTGLAEPGAAVTVRNASMDVYKGANIAISPVLPTLSLSVVRRENRQFLRLSSTRAVDAGYLHLFLELSEGGRANVRGTTLWLNPDPAPKPPPAPVVARPVPAPVLTMPAIAPIPAAALPRAMPAPPAPPAPVVRDSEPARKPVREITLTGKPAAACIQTEEQAKACAATEYKNGLLSAQVVELEEKVRQLQRVIEASAASTAVASATGTPAHGGSADASAVASAAAAAASASAPRPAIPPPPPKPAKPLKHEGEGLPWLLIGGGLGVLALLGGAGWFLMKRRNEAAAPATGSFMRRLASRFQGKAKSAPAPAAADADAT